MNYEIIATLGPASQNPSVWKEMLSAGATCFRLNTSHISFEGLQNWLDVLQDFCESQSEKLIPIYLDLQGSKWRLGQFQTFPLIPGETVELVFALSSERPGCLPVPHRDFFQAAVTSNGEMILNDAKSRLTMEILEQDRMIARVRQGGEISAHKGITFSECAFRSEALSEKDRAILDFTRSMPAIRYAISYLKDALEMKHYRDMIGPEAYLVAKIERRPAVDEPLEISQAANEIWLCRGDLGAELGLAGMARGTAQFSTGVQDLPIPAMMAGQVLEHMAARPTPTRSEVCYLFDTLQKGYSGFVLSDETAIGPHPVESCKIAAMFRNPS